MLHRLFDAKSQRDKEKFTIYKLAKALDMPHSMLVKLMHQDVKKRVINPRIDTLNKIVTYFNAEGFNITIDDLINGTVGDVVDISQITSTVTAKKTHTINIYSMNDFSLSLLDRKALKTIEIDLDIKNENIFGFESSNYIKPMFKKGSIFIIDRTGKIEPNSIISFYSKDNNSIKIGKTTKNNQFVCSLVEEEKCLSINEIILVGPVIHIDAKT